MLPLKSSSLSLINGKLRGLQMRRRISERCRIINVGLGKIRIDIGDGRRIKKLRPIVRDGVGMKQFGG
jgi:hypothetical protein